MDEAVKNYIHNILNASGKKYNSSIFGKMKNKIMYVLERRTSLYEILTFVFRSKHTPAK